MRFLIILALTLTLSMPVMAKDIVITVNGMVCDFCAQSLEKVFMKENGVQSLEISLEDKTVTVQMDDKTTLSDETIKKLVEWGGYDLVDINHVGG